MTSEPRSEPRDVYDRANDLLLHAARAAGTDAVVIGSTRYANQPSRLDVHISTNDQTDRDLLYRALSDWVANYNQDAHAGDHTLYDDNDPHPADCPARPDPPAELTRQEQLPQRHAALCRCGECLGGTTEGTDR